MKRRSEAERRRVVAAFHESGETRIAFARRHGIAVGTLAHWLERVRRRRGADAAAPRGAGVRFVELATAAVTPPAAATASRAVAMRGKPSGAMTLAAGSVTDPPPVATITVGSVVVRLHTFPDPAWVRELGMAGVPGC